ncbi:hypothetical protein LG329_10050 [Virgibacillus necropolis]|uniref:hypothetical protein n=1 Tax=Virgibacillus necropolis TaxID=163877 RepID=UPI00384A80D7
MFYIVVGICIAFVLIVLLLIDKFAGASEMMGNFKNSAFKKLIIGLSIAAVLSLSYGVYAKITYQPPFLDISVDGSSYTVFGEIGEIGYYANGLVTKDQATAINLVSWEDLNLDDDVEILVNYPSGKEVRWKANIVQQDSSSVNRLKDVHDIKKLYKLSPYTFIEAGDVTLTINDNGNKLLDFSIEVEE